MKNELDDVSVLKAALAKIDCPGPWRNSDVSDYAGSDMYNNRGGNFARTTSFAGSTIVADYITACSPDRIARILDRLEEYEAALKEIVNNDLDEIDAQISGLGFCEEIARTVLAKYSGQREGGEND